MTENNKEYYQNKLNKLDELIAWTKMAPKEDVDEFFSADEVQLSMKVLMNEFHKDT